MSSHNWNVAEDHHKHLDNLDVVGDQAPTCLTISIKSEPHSADFFGWGVQGSLSLVSWGN